MSIRIVTDSTCDLPAELIKKYRITVIPLHINSGTSNYRDGVDLSRLEFYERLPDFKPPATTSAPGIDTFKMAYERLATEDATEILSIHISVKLSAVLNVATQAAAETRGVEVTVFDSQQLSLGTGFQVLAAAQAAAEGRSKQEILTILEDLILRTHVFAALDTLEFLRRSGRMNNVMAYLGALLQIKPLLLMYAGNPTAERIRTQKGAHKRLVELFEKDAPYEKVALLHSNAAGRAKTLLAQVQPHLPAQDILFEEINPVLGAHIGPGVVGFVCISKKTARGDSG